MRHPLMQRKLRLRLDNELIAAAKTRVAKARKSLSKMAADYFEAITKARPVPVEMSPPVVRVLAGGERR